MQLLLFYVYDRYIVRLVLLVTRCTILYTVNLVFSHQSIVVSFILICTSLLPCIDLYYKAYIYIKALLDEIYKTNNFREILGLK